VEARLGEPPANLSLEIRVVRTTGDKAMSIPLDSGDTVGLFVREIEQELQAGRIDLAVHSLKDLPLTQPDGLCIAAIPIREDPRDVLVMRQGSGLHDLPHGAKIGTGSPRRVGQLLAQRADLRFEPIRGNVDTRLRKLAAGRVDALVLALAGLNRIAAPREGIHPIPLETVLPAPGQGALALEVRARDDGLAKILRTVLDDSPTSAAVRAERAFLKTLGGGCQMPVGALGRVSGHTLELQGVVAAIDGSRIIKDSWIGAADWPEQAGEDLGRRMLAAGAGDLLGSRLPLEKP
jgi:hydroxymethylbilane synthase